MANKQANKPTKRYSRSERANKKKKKDDFPPIIFIKFSRRAILTYRPGCRGNGTFTKKLLDM